MWHPPPKHITGSVPYRTGGVPQVHSFRNSSPIENNKLNEPYLITSGTHVAVERKSVVALEVTRKEDCLDVANCAESKCEEDFQNNDNEDSAMYDKAYEEEYTEVPKYRTWNEVKPLPKEGEIPIDSLKHKRRPKQQEIPIVSLVQDMDLQVKKIEKKTKNKKIKKNNGLKLIEELQKQARKTPPTKIGTQSLPNILYNDINIEQRPEKPKVEKHVRFMLPSPVKKEPRSDLPPNSKEKSNKGDQFQIDVYSKNGYQSQEKKSSAKNNSINAHGVSGNLQAAKIDACSNTSNNLKAQPISALEVSKSLIERYFNQNSEDGDFLINPKLINQSKTKKVEEEPLSISNLDGQSGLSLLSAATLNLSEDSLYFKTSSSETKIKTPKPQPKIQIPKEKPKILKKEEIKVQRAVPTQSQTGNLQVTLNQKAIQMAKEKMIKKAKKIEEVSQKLTSKIGLNIQLSSPKINLPHSQSAENITEAATEATKSAVQKQPEKAKTIQLSTKQIRKQTKVISLGPGGLKVTQSSESLPVFQKDIQDIQDVQDVNNVQKESEEKIKTEKNFVQKEEEELEETENYKIDKDSEEAKLRKEYQSAIEKEKEEIAKNNFVKNYPMPKVNMKEFFLYDKGIKRSPTIPKRLHADSCDGLLESIPKENENVDEDLIDAYISGHYSLSPLSIPGIGPDSTSFIDYYVYRKSSYDPVDIHSFSYLFDSEKYTERKKPVEVFIDLPSEFPPVEPQKPDRPKCWELPDPERPVWRTIESTPMEMRTNVTGFVVTRKKKRKPKAVEGKEKRKFCDRFNFCDRYFVATMLGYTILGALSVVFHLFDKVYC